MARGVVQQRYVERLATATLWKGFHTVATRAYGRSAEPARWQACSCCRMGGGVERPSSSEWGPARVSPPHQQISHGSHQMLKNQKTPQNPQATSRGSAILSVHYALLTLPRAELRRPPARCVRATSG